MEELIKMENEKLFVTPNLIWQVEKELKEKYPAIAHIYYSVIGNRTTVCLIQLKNGFEILGRAHTFKPENFDYITGKYWSAMDASKTLDYVMTNASNYRLSTVV
jgi:hypothetical protein